MEEIVRILMRHYPRLQAVYLFGSFGTEYEATESDADIGLLLPPLDARQAGGLAMSPARLDLEVLLSRDTDLINLRLVPVVLQKEVVMAERRVFCADPYAADDFEALVLSRYGKLNEERAGILADGLAGGRFYRA